jgi:hypothetical protein
VICTVPCARGQIAIFSADVVGKTDDQLLALVAERMGCTLKDST